MTNLIALNETLRAARVKLATESIATGSEYYNADGSVNWFNYAESTEYAVGKCGTQRSRYRGQTGEKVHLLTVRRIVAERGEHKPGTFTVGSVSGIRGCKNNGQFNGTIVKTADVEHITCTTCLKRLAAMEARGAVQS